MNIEYVLNDSTVFEKHQKEVRSALMEVLTVTKASSSFNTTPSRAMCIKMEHTLYLINIASPCIHLYIHINFRQTKGLIDKWKLLITNKKPILRFKKKTKFLITLKFKPIVHNKYTYFLDSHCFILLNNKKHFFLYRWIRKHKSKSTLYMYQL